MFMTEKKFYYDQETINFMNYWIDKTKREIKAYRGKKFKDKNYVRKLIVSNYKEKEFLMQPVDIVKKAVKSTSQLDRWIEKDSKKFHIKG